jgi:hypothetical protein
MEEEGKISLFSDGGGAMFLGQNKNPFTISLNCSMEPDDDQVPIFTRSHKMYPASTRITLSTNFIDFFYQVEVRYRTDSWDSVMNLFRGAPYKAQKAERSAQKSFLFCGKRFSVTN